MRRSAAPLSTIMVLSALVGASCGGSDKSPTAQEVDATRNASDAPRLGARTKLLTTTELAVAAINKTGELVPPMAHQSYPIPVRGGGSLQVVFLYCVARPVFGKGTVMLAPSHRAVLNASDGELKEVRPFSPQDAGVNDPPQKIFPFWKMPPDLTTEQFAARQELLFATYDKLLPLFAERHDPTAEDAASFDALFWQVSEGPLAPYYKAVGADFFAWLATAKR